MAKQTPPINESLGAESSAPKVFLWVREPAQGKGFPAVMQDQIPVDTTGLSGGAAVPTDSYNLVSDDVDEWDGMLGLPSNSDSIAAISRSRLAAAMSANLLFNGLEFDRQRGNLEEAIIASAARTASFSSADFTNYNAKGGHFIVNVTAVTDTPEVVITIEGKDPISGDYYPVLVSDTINSVGMTILKVYPGITGSANASANDILPRTYRVSSAHADADSITYSVSGALVV